MRSADHGVVGVRSFVGKLRYCEVSIEEETAFVITVYRRPQRPGKLRFPRALGAISLSLNAAARERTGPPAAVQSSKSQKTTAEVGKPRGVLPS